MVFGYHQEGDGWVFGVLASSVDRPVRLCVRVPGDGGEYLLGLVQSLCTAIDVAPGWHGPLACGGGVLVVGGWATASLVPGDRTASMWWVCLSVGHAAVVAARSCVPWVAGASTSCHVLCQGAGWL